jgi:hypothetical protein
LEAGYALGRHKAVVWVVSGEHVFCWHPWVRRCEDWIDVVRALLAIAAERRSSRLPRFDLARRPLGGWT